jgi:hypothetical protein
VSASQKTDHAVPAERLIALPLSGRLLIRIGDVRPVRLGSRAAARSITTLATGSAARVGGLTCDPAHQGWRTLTREPSEELRE